MLITRNMLALGALTGALAVTGCGGGSKSLSKADLAKQAGDICAKASKDISAIQPPSNLQDASAAAAYFSKVAPIGENAMKKLKALKPPDSDKDAWNTYISKQQAETDLIVQLFHKAQKKDRSGLQDLQKVPALDRQVNAAAKAAGVPGCASSA
jgi:hypothetical protein